MNKRSRWFQDITRNIKLFLLVNGGSRRELSGFAHAYLHVHDGPQCYLIMSDYASYVPVKHYC